ncbi:NAD(P)H-dependent flavin oxidoreductase [Pseudomonas japonica]|uniref:NAD(P)H-dependent flavin oxidoreductase n=1 Tax=Pseudomonas japonica TaxID=256466 RepID=UPI0015E335E3|nr:nitronate monooxygenase [Pseudomonas japonica]MBA1243558.1 nitronate monooxygenase [Pseudomonas japonica]
MPDSLLQRLNITVPIIQAPMVGVSTPTLAAAVSNAGGLGSLGLGASSSEQARAMIAEARALTCGPLNLNLFCHAPAQAQPEVDARWLQGLVPLFAEFGATPPATMKEIYRTFVGNHSMLEVLLDARPAAVSFHFGLPGAEAIEALKAVGAVLLCSVTSLEEAEQAVAAGVDALIAQGYEAGGHRGVFDPARDTQLGTLALVRLLAQRVNLPLIAAGGIMDGVAARACLDLGASAVQLGTAFIRCPESAASPAYREALVGPRGHDTRITAAISGRPARGLVNRNFTSLGSTGIPDYPLAYDAQKALAAAAAAKGSGAFAVQWAGQGAPLARAMPAGELVRVLVEEMWQEGNPVVIAQSVSS